jgi:dihydrofolate reductase
VRVSLIVALDRGGLIGREGGLPWRLPRDLKRFQRLTLGKPIIMGRKTFASIGRPLPGRSNIVLSRTAAPVPAECRLARSLPEALAIAEAQAGPGDAAEALVIGGAEVFREAAPQCDTLYLTVVDGRFPGDTYFPVAEVVGTAWRVVSQEKCPADERNPVLHWFFVLERQREGDRTAAQATGASATDPRRLQGVSLAAILADPDAQVGPSADADGGVRGAWPYPNS